MAGGVNINRIKEYVKICGSDDAEARFRERLDTLSKGFDEKGNAKNPVASLNKRGIYGSVVGSILDYVMGRADSYEDNVDSIIILSAITEFCVEKLDKGADKSGSGNAEFKKIVDLWGSFIDITQLLNVYRDLFMSGYQVDKPAGVCMSKGIMHIVGDTDGGSRAEIKPNCGCDDNMQYRIIYNYICRVSKFAESENRGVRSMANDMVNGYLSDPSTCIYFPMKMLEFAYGRTYEGDVLGEDSKERNGATTYSARSSCSSWDMYSKSEASLILKSVFNNAIVLYVKILREHGRIASEDDELLLTEIPNFIDYVSRCMSICFIFTEYNIASRKVTNFSLRTSDTSGYFMRRDVDVTNDIVNQAFRGIVVQGQSMAVPTVYKDNTGVAEFRYEFNHKLSQATPLFSYKVLEALKANGEVNPDGSILSWENVVLGRAQDGSILRSSNDENAPINLMSTWMHVITAGSRAGKGVMTLNLLAAVLSAGRPLFYLDSKPDMAAMIKKLNGDAFVVNAQHSPTYDKEGSGLSPADLNKVAEKVCGPEFKNLNGGTVEWYKDRTPIPVGPIAYMRAVLFVAGIAYALGRRKKATLDFLGTEGIVLVMDEFSNLSDALGGIMRKLSERILPDVTILRSELASLNKIKNEDERARAEREIMTSRITNENFYVMSLLKTLEISSSKMWQLADAGMDDTVASCMDVFLIGQEVLLSECTPPSKDIALQFRVNSLRKRSKGNGALKSGTGDEEVSCSWAGLLFNGGANILTGMLTAKYVPDVFIGRNKTKILGSSEDKNSPTYGLLDDIAKNFAYKGKFAWNSSHVHQRSEETRKILDGDYNEAKEFKYFKPYLTLNESGPWEGKGVPQCVSEFVDGLYNKSGLSEEAVNAILADNGDLENKVLNPGCGFEGYISMASGGNTDLKSVLSMASGIANRILENMGYKEGWQAFVADTRPEWLFTVDEIADAIFGEYNSDLNSKEYLREWLEFIPERFGEQKAKIYADHELDMSGMNVTDPDEDVEKYVEGVENTELGRALEDEDGYNEYSGRILSESSEDTSQEPEIGMEPSLEAQAEELDDDDVDFAEGNVPTSGGEIGEVVPDNVVSISDMRTRHFKKASFGSDVSEQAIADVCSRVNPNAQQVLNGTNVSVRDVVEKPFHLEPDFGAAADFSGVPTYLESKDDFLINLCESLDDIIMGWCDTMFGGIQNVTAFTVTDSTIQFRGRLISGSSAGRERDVTFGLKSVQGVPRDVARKLANGQVVDYFNFGRLLSMTGASKFTFRDHGTVRKYIQPQIGDSVAGVTYTSVLFQNLPKLQVIVDGTSVISRDMFKTYDTTIIEDARKFEKLSNSANAYMFSHFKDWGGKVFGPQYSMDHKVHLFKRCGCGVLALLSGAGAAVTGVSGAVAGRRRRSKAKERLYEMGNTIKSGMDSLYKN